MMRRLAGLLAGLAWCVVAAAAAYDDPWSPTTEQAAQAAVARLDGHAALGVAARTHAVIATTHSVLGLGDSVAGAARDVRTTVQDLAVAKRQLGARENDLEVHVALPADVLFDFDKADIRPDASKALAQLATVIRAYSGPVRLEGHTDSKGGASYNQSLSERRAESVKRWLVQHDHVPASRITTRGFGKTRPIASNDTEAGRQKNRRVEVVIRKH